MTLVLADVGGTNVRFATAESGSAGIDPARVRRFENNRYTDFDAALDAYLDEMALPRIDGFSIAVAGPVSGRQAKLTNRHWTIDADALETRHMRARVHLLNDLSALGYALEALPKDGTELLLAGEPGQGDQKLVVGVGTGMNVSPVISTRGHIICLRAEAGLSSLPDRAAAMIRSELGYLPDWVRCSEDLLSGLGLARLYGAVSGAGDMDGRAVVSAADAGDAVAQRALTLFARALAEMIQNLRLLYMASGGVVLAGSVARGVLASSAREALLAPLRYGPSHKSKVAPSPVSLIVEDEAALLGCLAYAREVG